MKVVHCMKDKYDIYIGRPSKWGNPFSIGVDGTRDEVIIKYEAYIRNKKELLDSLHELVGKVLGCYCAPEACHGDILIKLIKELDIEQRCPICGYDMKEWIPYYQCRKLSCRHKILKRKLKRRTDE